MAWGLPSGRELLARVVGLECVGSLEFVGFGEGREIVGRAGRSHVGLSARRGHERVRRAHVVTERVSGEVQAEVSGRERSTTCRNRRVPDHSLDGNFLDGGRGYRHGSVVFDEHGGSVQVHGVTTLARG